MKKSFVWAAVCCLVISGAFFTSCKNKGYSKTEYFLGILEADVYATNSDEDKAIFEQYLTDKGFKNTGEGETFGYYGTLKWNEDENYADVFDALWKPMEAKLSYDEVDALPVSDAFHVEVGVATGSTRESLSPTVIWRYPNGTFSAQWTVIGNPMTVPQAGVTDTTFTIQCSRDWTATVDKDWVTFSPQSGEANQEYTIHVKVDAGEKEYAKIEFKARRVEATYTFYINRDDNDPLAE